MPKSNTDYKVQDNLAVLVVGDPKVGKTRLMMSFPEPYILDLDKNLGSAVRVNGSKQFWYDQVDIDETGKSVPPEQQWLRIVSLLEAAVKEPRYKTICIDSLTRLGEINRNYMLGKLKTMGVKLRSDTIDDQLRQADYGTYAVQLLKIVALCRASGKIVVWTSHQAVREDELTGKQLYYLSIPGALKSSLGGYFTDVWGMSAGPATRMKGTTAESYTKYSIRTKPTGYHVALGCSFPLDPEIDITDRTPEQIWSLLGPKLLPITTTGVTTTA
jgi:hypothetical protein